MAIGSVCAPAFGAQSVETGFRDYVMRRTPQRHRKGVGRRSAITFALLVLAPMVCGAQTVIPFDLRHGLVYIPAQIDGTPVHVVLDTGTGGIVVDDQHAKKLDLHIGGFVGQAPGGGTGNQAMFSLELSSVRFGPINLRDVSGIAMNLSPLFADAGTSFTALLGYQIFEHHAITIDYAKRKVIVYPPDKPPSCRLPIPITGFVGNTPIVAATVRFAGSPKIYRTHLIVDTGTIGGIAVFLGEPFLHLKAVRQLIARKPVAHGNGTGGKIFSWHGTLTELNVGSQHFRNLPMSLSGQVGAFNTKAAPGSLGVQLWHNGSLTINYPQRKLCIDVPSNTRARSAHEAKLSREAQ